MDKNKTKIAAVDQEDSKGQDEEGVVQETSHSPKPSQPVENSEEATPPDSQQEAAATTEQAAEVPAREESEPAAEPAPETTEASEPSQPSEPDLSAESPAEEETPTKENKSSVAYSSPSKDAKGAYWYVVHTYSGHEAKVAATLKQRIESQKLEDKILEILVPTQEKIEIKEGKKSTVREKIFPGYILIKMILDDYSWLAVRTTPGITSFVGNAQKPTPLPESEVATIQRFMSMEAPKFKTTFSIGEAVKIVDGPFSEFLGSVQELDEEKGKVKVLVSIFGRETPVELDFLQIAKL